MMDRITTPEGLQEMLKAAGVARAEIVAEPGEHMIGSAEDRRLVGMGSGYRGTLVQLDKRSLERMREKSLSALGGCTAVTTKVVYAITRK